MVWKLSRWSGNFPDSRETFRIAGKLSGWSGNFPDGLETFRMVGKLSGWWQILPIILCGRVSWNVNRKGQLHVLWSWENIRWWRSCHGRCNSLDRTELRFCQDARRLNPSSFIVQPEEPTSHSAYKEGCHGSVAGFNLCRGCCLREGHFPHE